MMDDDMMQSLLAHPSWDDFEEYHAAHPETYRFFVQMARMARERGYNRISIKWLIEIGRWETGQDMSLASGFRHDFQSIYARLIMAWEPDLEDAFEIRKLAHERG